MIERLFISYSLSERLVYNFWKSFFQMCGIWLEEEEIWGDDYIFIEDMPHLLILGGKDDKYILPVVKENRVYLVKRNATFAKYEDRSDVIKMDRWEKTEKVFSLVLKKLLGLRSESIQIKGLLKIFIEEKLWNVMWLHNEMAFCKDEFYNKYINIACEKAIRKLDGIVGWHYNYMQLYCNYIKYGISVDSMLKRSTECVLLLDNCNEMSSMYGWNAQLYLIAGKICELSQTERRYALNYYENIMEDDRNAEVLYCIGHGYEKIKIDSDSAINYYKESYKLNQNYFRAAYKVAKRLEGDGKWMEAFLIYGKIELILEKYSLSDSISIKEIEYRYKIYMRLIDICDKHIIGYSLIRNYEAEIENIIEQIKQGKTFTKLLHCMFGRKEINVRKQVLNDICKKSLMECLN